MMTIYIHTRLYIRMYCSIHLLLCVVGPTTIRSKRSFPLSSVSVSSNSLSNFTHCPLPVGEVPSVVISLNLGLYKTQKRRCSYM